MRLLLLAALLVSGCASPSQPPAAEQASFPGGRLIDLSHSFDASTPYWPTADNFELQVDFKGETEGGYWYESNTFRSSEHGGTHLDAPAHFAEGMPTTEAIDLKRLIAPAILIDVAGDAAENPDYLVSVADFEAWEAQNGAIPDGHIVLIRTGYAGFWPDRQSYMGTAQRGADAVPLLHFPGLDPEAAAWLVANRDIAALGIDTASIDYGQSSTYMSHQTLFGASIPAFENVGDMSELPATGFHIVALPMKIAGGSGGPLRIVAILP